MKNLVCLNGYKKKKSISKDNRTIKQIDFMQSVVLGSLRDLSEAADKGVRMENTGGCENE